MKLGYLGPADRPEAVDEYYSKSESYTSFTEEVIAEATSFTVKKISIETPYGSTQIDYYAGSELNKDLIFVFPVLGGRKNLIASYFADTFVREGFDTAIVHRSNEFKKTENLDRLEEILRKNVIRDRIAIDFFENEYKKKNFGTFGISRGAINVAVTAGVDERLQYNVMALGGSDIVGVFRESKERRINKFKRKVMEDRGWDEEQFYSFLERQIKTDPKSLAKYIDARNALMFLCLFDDSVPYKYGEKLRADIGRPRSVYLAAGHKTSVAFTQIVNYATAVRNFPIYPFDYIETESISFYEKSFNRSSLGIRHTVFRLLQFPFTVVARIVSAFQGEE